MKIEKINENQIRCTLTREDLESHQVNLKELAYGSEKAKKLFRDMMQQAQIQLILLFQQEIANTLHGQRRFPNRKHLKNMPHVIPHFQLAVNLGRLHPLPQPQGI